jgi:hypothetical protein
MGLGKITRGLGKVGLAFEALGYAWSAGSTLLKRMKGKRSGRNPGDGAGVPDEGARNHADDDEPELECEQ